MAGGFHSPCVPSFNAIDIIRADDVRQSQKGGEIMTSSHVTPNSAVMFCISATIQSFTATDEFLKGRLVAATMS